MTRALGWSRGPGGGSETRFATRHAGTRGSRQRSRGPAGAAPGAGAKGRGPGGRGGAAFAKFDKDKDGKITKEDCRKICSRCSINLTETKTVLSVATRFHSGPVVVLASRRAKSNSSSVGNEDAAPFATAPH